MPHNGPPTPDEQRRSIFRDAIVDGDMFLLPRNHSIRPGQAVVQLDFRAAEVGLQYRRMIDEQIARMAAMSAMPSYLVRNEEQYDELVHQVVRERETAERLGLVPPEAKPPLTLPRESIAEPSRRRLLLK